MPEIQGISRGKMLLAKIQPCKDTFVAFLAHCHIEIMPVTPVLLHIILTLQNNLKADKLLLLSWLPKMLKFFMMSICNNFCKFHS